MRYDLSELLRNITQSAQIDGDLTPDEAETLNALAEILEQSDITEVSELEDFIAKHDPPIISP